MQSIIIFTIGKWKFAVRKRDLSMILNDKKRFIERWDNHVLNEEWEDIPVINESQESQFSNYIYFVESGTMRCLGVDSMCHPKAEKQENFFFFSNIGEDDGIIGLFTEREEITSIVDLGKFFKRWFGSMGLVN
jgi:hypothetical protein